MHLPTAGPPQHGPGLQGGPVMGSESNLVDAPVLQLASILVLFIEGGKKALRSLKERRQGGAQKGSGDRGKQ